MKALIIMLCTALWCSAGVAQPTNVEPRQWLLSQVRLGEALYRDDLIRDSLTRLYEISPNDPSGLEAELRLAVRHNDLENARALLDRLRQNAPESQAYKQASLLLKLQNPEESKALQQARLLALAGRLDESLAAYNKLFGQTPPTLELALEYWKLRSRLPNDTGPALTALLKLDQDYPRNTPLRQTLVNLLFEADRDEEGLAMLHSLAADPAAHNAAAEREFEYLSAQAPTSETAQRWQEFLNIYINAPIRLQAEKSLAAIQMLLDDPAWQAGREGLELLDQGENALAETALMRSLEKYPDDANLIGGLGIVYMRTQRRAQALSYFKLAHDKEKDSYRTQKWIDLIASTSTWLLLEQADASAQSGHWREAQDLYEQAYQRDQGNVQAVLGLGDTASGLGDTEKSERYYKQALELEPTNMSALRALLRIYEAQSPTKAMAFLDELPDASRQSFLAQRTQLELDLLKTQADKALAKKDLAQASDLLDRAQKLEPNDIWLAYHLANARQDQGQSALADEAFARLLQHQGQNPEARYAHALFLSSRDQTIAALASLNAVPTATWSANMRSLASRLDSQRIEDIVLTYEKESPEKAISFLDSLSAASRKPFLDLRTRLEVDLLKKQADEAAAHNNLSRASELLKQAQALAPDDIWLTYSLANAYQDQGEFALANNVFNHLLKRQGQNSEARYAHALFLSSAGQSDQALASLNMVDTSSWSVNMQDLAKRLALRQLLANADALRTGGDEAAAIALLQGQPANNDIDFRLADWAQQRKDYREALAIYERILMQHPADVSARLGQIEVWLDEGKIDLARRSLETDPITLEPTDANSRRRLANAWAAVGDTAKAKAIMNNLMSSLSRPDALLLRDAARLMRDEQPQMALDLYAQAMQENELIPPNTEASGRDNDALTRATRANRDDDWLRRSLRSDTEALYQQQNPTLHLHNEFWGSRDGTPGLSDLRADTTIMQLDMPLKGGRAFARAERVFMDAGRFDTKPDNSYDNNFGTCALQDCTSGHTQQATGVSPAIGWHNDKISADIGTTPLGFKVVDVVGGFTYKGNLKSLGWSATVSRRAMSNSILSYAGTTDPNTGITWGGVRATGASLGLSWDEGGPNGVWANLSYHHLTGKNVASNDRFRLMAGYYRRLIDAPDQQLTIGVNTMLWHYAKDLSGYTLGQGGYYSPQRYVSLSVPIQYAWRNNDWSYRLNGSVAWSRSHTNASNDYPIAGLLPARMSAGLNDTSASSSSSGFGYTLGGQIERRLSKHTVLGAAIDIQRANDYNPSRAMLYLRYTFEPWRGNLPQPPSPLTSYADF
ncbi:cellulose biosynthesis protein BcsC [Alcaligenaceae bacterium CGII-47]|nr:cellulose biosynthesis protein BcsC [Alcaligenaceae bacterium CGII-47]